MYSIDGDITFDDYTVEIDMDYLCNDYDVVEQQTHEEYNNNIDEETDVQFE